MIKAPPPSEVALELRAARVNQMADDVERWADAFGWATHRMYKRRAESRTGERQVPFIRVRTPNGQLHLDPIGLDVIGADARVDLESWPNLNRVVLLGGDGGWQVRTDRRVTLPEPWGRDLFRRPADDLPADRT